MVRGACAVTSVSACARSPSRWSHRVSSLQGTYLPSTSHDSKHCNPATSLCVQSKVTEVAREMPAVGAAIRPVPKPASPPLLAQGVLERNILSRCSEVEAKWGESLRRSLGRTLTPDDVLAADTCARSEQCRGSPRRTAALDAMRDAG